MTLKIVQTPYHSLCQGDLPDGCKMCVTGEKLVLFVTGICPANCFFCPLSEEKKMKDVIFANEKELSGSEDDQLDQMIVEARANKANGAGVTGGDPLARLDRTCKMIRRLKKEFGKGFHIHLYTPLILVNEITMKKLYEAGLDEIRFHPSLSSEKFWPRMEIAKKYPWHIGMEIPIFPDKLKETKRLVDYCAEHKLISFLNLNELEISELTIETFEKKGYEVTKRESYAIKGSRAAGRKIMLHAQQYNLAVHFCTTTLKDRVQMGNRIIRRADCEAWPFDIVDKEGLLLRGAIYINYSPEFSYNKKLKALSVQDKQAEHKELTQIYNWLQEMGMPQDAGFIDEKKHRVVLSADVVRDIAQDLVAKFKNAKPYVIKEYPTSDSFIVELEPAVAIAKNIVKIKKSKK